MTSFYKLAIFFCLILALPSVLVDAMLLNRRASELATMLAGGMLTLLFTEVIDKPRGTLTFGKHSYGGHNFDGHFHGDFHNGGQYPGGIYISQHPSKELPLREEYHRGFTLGKLGDIFGIRKHIHTTPLEGHRRPHFLSNLGNFELIRNLGQGVPSHTNNFHELGIHRLRQKYGQCIQFPEGGKYGHASRLTHLSPIYNMNRFGNDLGFTQSTYKSNQGLRHIINNFGQAIPIENLEHEIVPFAKIHGIPLEFSNIPLNIESGKILHELPRNSEGVSVSYSSS